MKNNFKPIISVLLVIFLTSVYANAATMSASLGDPVVDDADIANIGGATGTDKWWAGTEPSGRPKGQSFTTGAEPARLNSISYQIADNQQATATKEYVIRLNTVYGTMLTEIHTETATQTFTWNSSEYMTWTFDTPVLLAPHTVYGIDIGMTSSTSAWQTGIPYLQTSDNNYSAGKSYTSGTQGRGIGDETMNTSTSDRIFHIDMTTVSPAAPGYVSPQHGQMFFSGVTELSWTNLVPSTGSDVWVDVWFGTDPSSGFNKVVDAGLNATSVSVDASVDGRYYWKVDSYLDGSSSGSPVEGVVYTFYVNSSAEPNTLSAIAALKNHVLGTPTLTDPNVIASHKGTIDENQSLLSSNINVLSAALDLIQTYDTTPGFGPLWVNQPDFRRSSVVDGDIHYTIYCLMQYVIDVTYTTNNIISYENLLDGFIFDCSSHFPGSVNPPADPDAVYTVSIDAIQPKTFGRPTMYTKRPARKPTGAYAAPGSIVTVTVPPSLVDSGYSIRVGAHSPDHSNKPWMKRLDRSSLLFYIENTETKVASPLGGGIYIEVPYLGDAGIVDISIKNAVRSPYFSAKGFHSTTPTDWQTIERNHPAPWADFQSEKFMMTVPTDWIYAFDDPISVLQEWNEAMDVINDLMGFPHYRGNETMYPIIDVQNKNTVFAPGYPSCNSSYNPNTSYGGNLDHYLLTGPQYSPDWIFHEEGHAYGIPGKESESTMNLLHVPMAMHFGNSLDYSFAASRGYQGNPDRTLDNTAVAWMCSFNFSPREVEMHKAEKVYQLKGHAKYVEIANLFGWDVLGNYWKSYNDDYENGISYSGDMDSIMLRMSKHAGCDIRPLFHFWGIHPSDPNALAAAIQAEGLNPSLDIYNRLNEYKALIPANNAEFQTFAFNWWGHVPNPEGLWTESEHGRQWDSTEWYVQNNNEQQRPELTVGEMYVEAVADDIRGDLQKIIDLYFPDGSPAYYVTLDDMITWSGEPTVIVPIIANQSEYPLTYAWSSIPTEDISFSATNIESPTVTVNKPAGDPAIYTISLTVSDGVNPDTTNTMTMEVYDNSCQASRLGLGLTDSSDLNGDCLVNLEDIAIVAEKWFGTAGLSAPAHKLR